ncbi:MAG: hypothetical protein ACXWHF_03010 [Chthoniobacterales bacterium]
MYARYFVRAMRRFALCFVRVFVAFDRKRNESGAFVKRISITRDESRDAFAPWQLPDGATVDFAATIFVCKPALMAD